MRRVITGVKDGKSCVVEVREITPGGDQGGVFDFVQFAVDPPPPRPPGHGALLDLHVPQGHVKWSTSYSPPNAEFATVHHTDSIDCHAVIQGSCALILDDGAHWLEVGDFVIVNGVDHAWKTGPQGSLCSSLFIATPPPAEG
jgi:hypothetical protein